MQVGVTAVCRPVAEPPADMTKPPAPTRACSGFTGSMPVSRLSASGRSKRGIVCENAGRAVAIG